MLNWLFEIGPVGTPTHRVALSGMTYNSNAYAGVVKPDSFRGVVLNRVKVELGQVTRSEVSFDIVASYTLADLIGQPLVIREVTGTTTGDMIGAWRYKVETASSAYGVITVTAVDQLTSVMDGVWPNTSLVRDLFPEAAFSHGGLDDTACVPVVFGTSSYIPVQSKSAAGEVYYILGTGNGSTHTVTEITSPSNIDNQIQYTVNTDIWVEGSTDGTYSYAQVFFESGLVTSRFWRSGADRVAPFMKYSKTGMTAYTNPVDILRYILEDCGIASVDFDATWDSVATAVAARGYTYSRGFYQHLDRADLVCQLLAAADSTIYQSGNRVSIALNSKASITTISSSDVIKTSIEEHGDFSWDRMLPAKNDSAYITYFTPGEPQTKLVKAKVTASGTTATPSTDVLDLSGVSSDTAAQALGTLYFHKKYTRNGECSFTGHPDLVTLRPGQVVTINDTLYGPSVSALVESVTINRDSTVKVVCSTYSTAILDFADVSTSAITPVADTATGAITTLSQANSYTDSELEAFDPPDTSTWNNRNATAITAPTIVGTGAAVDHVINTDGSANISFEWAWSGDEAVIDGFQVYWYASSSASAYTFGTDTANEQTAPVLPDCRAVVCPSVAADKYYSFAVRAYRKVDADISATGLIVSSKVSPALSSENPYRPSASVAFAGDITGTLNGTAVATVVTNAGTGATHAGTAHAPSNADVTQVVLNAGAAIDNAKVNGQVLVVGGYINADVLEITSTMIVGTINWSTQVGGTGKPADYADRTITVIEGGIITTGTIQVYYGSSGLTAGITGQTSGDTSVRIWAGASFANRTSAPFRVTQAGAVTCSNITITGGSIGSAATINGTAASTVVSQASAGSTHAGTAHAPSNADATATIIEGGLTTTGTLQVYNGTSGLTAGITGNGVGDTLVRIWAGASLANRGTAPFRVTQAGAVVCSNITITGGTFGGAAVSTVVSQASVGSNHAGSTHADPNATVGAPDGTYVGSVAAATVATAATNFNSSNDRNSSAITNPTIPTGAVEHTTNTDGSVNISFEWTWSGSEGVIDGFFVYLRQSTSSAAYAFGTDYSQEALHTVSANKRAYIWYGVPANQYYTFGVQAYRRVDADINSTGVIKSSLVKVTLSGANPYQPSSSVAFSGDITGTINGTATSTVVSQAYAGSYHSTTAHAPSDADKTSLNTALDTLAVAGLTSSTIAGWRYGSTVYMDGGDIYAGTVTAYQIAANTITASKIYAGTITANEIASGTITGDRIAGNTITGSKITSDTITLDKLNAGYTGSIVFTGCQMTFADGADLICQSTSDSSSAFKMTRSGYEFAFSLHSSGSYLRLSPKNGVGTGGIVIGYDSTNMAYACGIVASNNIGLSIGTSTAYSFQNDGFYPLTTGKVLGLQTYPWNNGFFNEIMIGNTGASGVSRIKSLGRGTGTATYGWVHQNSSGQTRFQVRDDGAVLSGHIDPVASDTYYCGTSTSARWAGAYIAYVNAVGVAPPTANTGYLGTISQYYNTCFINVIRYKTSSTFDSMDDLEVIHSIGPATDTAGKPILNEKEKYGCKAKPMTEIHPAITNYSQLADELNEEHGTTLTFEDIQAIVAGEKDPVQVKDVELYAEDFLERGAAVKYAPRLDGRRPEIDQLIVGEIEGPVVVKGPLIDKDFIEGCVFFDAGATAQLSLGGLRQLDKYITEEVVEQVNALIEGLTTRLATVETILTRRMGSGEVTGLNN